MQKTGDGLFFDRIVKTFGGTQALRGVSLHVARGEILALLGENGAGKSTLIKVLGGIYKADSGEVLIDGETYVHAPGRVNHRQAVAFIHQDLGLIDWMTVAENIALALGYTRSKGLINWSGAEQKAREALKLVDCDFDPTQRVADLSRTEKSLVAIARALAVECDFLVLDEPTASLPADEVERLFTALRPLRDKGVGMIYVSHRLDEIFRIADRVAVLRDGNLVGVREIQHTSPEELVSMIVGRKTREITRPAASEGMRSSDWRIIAQTRSAPSICRSTTVRWSDSSASVAQATRTSDAAFSARANTLVKSPWSARPPTSPAAEARWRRASDSSRATALSNPSRRYSPSGRTPSSTPVLRAEARSL